MLEWLQIVLSLVLPTVRWERGVERAGKLYAASPKGTGRKLHRRRITRLNDNLRQYREEFPPLEKVTGWIVTLAGVAMVVSWVSNGAAATLHGYETEYGPIWLLVIAYSVASYGSCAVNTVRGRLPNGMTPRQHNASIEADGRAAVAARHRDMIRRRARRAFRVSR